MKKIISILMLVSLPFLFWACESDKANEKPEEKSVAVKVYNVSPTSISSYIKLTGGISAVDDAIVYSKTSEKLKQLNVETGDKVSSGQVLAVQENNLAEQGVKQAEAQLKTAKAQLAQVKLDYERSDRLYKEKAVSEQQFEQAKTQLTSAEASVELAEAALGQARENYQNSFIKAPFAGTVAAIFFDVNEMVPAGQPVVQIVNSKGMKARLQLSSKDLEKIHKGQKVKVTFPAIKDKEYEGYIHDLDEAVDPLTKTLEAEVRISDVDSRLKSGMFGQFYIETTEKDSVITVPNNALLTQTEVILNQETGEQEPVKKYFLFLAVNNQAALKEVKAGIQSEGRIEIKDGLGFGDKVIVLGQNVVKDGQPVNIVN